MSGVLQSNGGVLIASGETQASRGESFHHDGIEEHGCSNDCIVIICSMSYEKPYRNLDRSLVSFKDNRDDCGTNHIVFKDSTCHMHVDPLRSKLQTCKFLKNC